MTRFARSGDRQLRSPCKMWQASKLRVFAYGFALALGIIFTLTAAVNAADGETDYCGDAEFFLITFVTGVQSPDPALSACYTVCEEQKAKLSVHLENVSRLERRRAAAHAQRENRHYEWRNHLLSDKCQAILEDVTIFWDLHAGISLIGDDLNNPWYIGGYFTPTCPAFAASSRALSGRLGRRPCNHPWALTEISARLVEPFLPMCKCRVPVKFRKIRLSRGNPADEAAQTDSCHPSAVCRRLERNFLVGTERPLWMCMHALHLPYETSIPAGSACGAPIPFAFGAEPKPYGHVDLTGTWAERVIQSQSKRPVEADIDDGPVPKRFEVGQSSKSDSGTSSSRSSGKDTDKEGEAQLPWML